MVACSLKETFTLYNCRAKKQWEWHKGYKKMVIYLVPLIINTAPTVQYSYVDLIHAYSVKIKIGAD
jgi:hypothetical protein